MPAYVSHTIMAYDVYNKIDNKNISLDYMLTFSLGGDLTRFSKCRRISHKIKQEEFIDCMWKYIKDNDLVSNGRYMGCLYGHICHYYMDIVCHPLIRMVDKLSKRVKVKSHTLIEGYIDSYLVRWKYNCDIDEIDTRVLFRGRVRNVKNMIDYTYMETYGIKNLSFSYCITKFMYSKIRWLFLIFGKKLLKKFSRFNKYIDINKDLDIVNDSNMISYKDYLNRECNDSFMGLYECSINLAIKRINNLK